MIPSDHIKTTLSGYVHGSEICMYVIHESKTTELKLEVTGQDEHDDLKQVGVWLDLERDYQAAQETVTVEKTNG